MRFELALIVGLCLGLSGCAKHQFEHTLTIDAPFDILWEVWTDVPNWPEWDTEMRTARLDDEETGFVEGARGLVVSADGELPIVISRVVERGYTLTFELPGSTMNIDRDAVEAADDAGWTITHVFRFEGLTSPVVASLRSGFLEEILPPVMENLKEIVERRAAE